MALRCEISDRVRLTCVAAALFACAQGSLAAGATAGGTNEYEQQAVKVANEFMAAKIAGDPVKAASYMAEDVELRVNVSKPAVKGRDTALELLKGMTGNNLNWTGPKRVKQVIETTSALGGADAVMVIQRRIDDFEINGKAVSYPIGAMYRIRVKDWKIEEWVDLPLVMPNFGPPREGAVPPPASAPSTQ